MRASIRVAATIAVALLTLPALAEEPAEVVVKNFPETQKVAGAVGVEGTIAHAALARLSESVVTPVGLTETLRQSSIGKLDSAGFTEVVLSLIGETKGTPRQAGAVGVILVPDESEILRVYREKGSAPYTLRIEARDVSEASADFAGDQVRLPVAFPRYKAFAYNTTDKPVALTLYAYLTN